MEIVKAMLAGEQDPKLLASVKHPRIKSSTATIILYLPKDVLIINLVVF
jgi:hypothetical protein